MKGLPDIGVNTVTLQTRCWGGGIVSSSEHVRKPRK